MIPYDVIASICVFLKIINSFTINSFQYSRSVDKTLMTQNFIFCDHTFQCFIYQYIYLCNTSLAPWNFGKKIEQIVTRGAFRWDNKYLTEGFQSQVR